LPQIKLKKFVVRYLGDNMRDFEMPKVDPDKEDEMPEVDLLSPIMDSIAKKLQEGGHVDDEWIREYFAAPKEDEISRKECAGESQINQYARYLKGKAGKVCPVFDESKCSHSWKSYTGLSEQFVFCEKCDERK
jgi:hypothetical protein